MTIALTKYKLHRLPELFSVVRVYRWWFLVNLDNKVKVSQASIDNQKVSESLRRLATLTRVSRTI